MRQSDTAGAMVVIEDLEVRRGPVQLMSNVNWRVMEGERWGIVGANGCGKSSLLGHIVGTYESSAGGVAVKRGCSVGYLEQTAVTQSARSVRDEVMSRMGAVAEARSRLAHEDTEAAREAFDEAGGYEAERDVARVASGLGFSATDLDRPCSEFSGGWQMRIGLARLLLSKPELLVLDEPTNHMDSNARSWLASYLAAYKGTLILVSHDAAMMRRVCTSIAEVAAQTVEIYKSKGYEGWRSERAERAQRWVATHARQTKQAAELEDFVRRFGASATKASQAKDRQKKLERLREEMLPEPPSDVVALAATAGDHDANQADDSAETTSSAGSLSVRRKAKLVMPEPPPCGAFPVALRNATLAWGSAAPVVVDADLVVEKGMRLVIRGPNGAGKSTVAKALAQVVSCEGRVADPRLALGYFAQDSSQQLDPSLTALQVCLQAARAVREYTSEADARRVLGALGLTGDKALRIVGSLSGGEKARVALACLALVPSNCLVLDECSNHLDVDTLDELADALNNYKGAIVVVSHDKAFVDKLQPTHVARLQDRTLTVQARGLTEDDWNLAPTQSSGWRGAAAPTDDDAPPPPVIAVESKAERRRRMNAPKLIAKLETKIADAELAIADLDDQLVAAGTDFTACLPLTEQRDKLQTDLDALYEEYAELDNLLVASTAVAAR